MIDPNDDAAAAGFMTLMHHYHDEAGTGHTDEEYESLISRIAVHGSQAHTDEEGEEMGPTVEIRFHGHEDGRLVQILLDAHAALELVGRLAYAAGKAIDGD